MFKLDDNLTYLMPAHFGGGPFDPEVKISQKSKGLTISYLTERDILENYIPEEFELLSPEIQIGYCEFTEISWMMGLNYNLVDISVPVRFNGSEDQLDGSYSLVVWENKTAPIIGGREQTGIPKIFADIENLQTLKPYYATTASLNGNQFLNINFEAKREIINNELDAVKAVSESRNTIGWRYIPKVGKPGAELSQFILYPQGMNVEVAIEGTASLKWNELTPMQNPSQFHIINSLANLPIKKLNGALYSEGTTILRAFGAKIIK